MCPPLTKSDAKDISGRMQAYTFKIGDNEITVPYGDDKIDIGECIQAFESCRLNTEQQATLKQFFLHFNDQQYPVCDQAAGAMGVLNLLKESKELAQELEHYNLCREEMIRGTFVLSFKSPNCLEFDTTYPAFEYERTPVEIKYHHVFHVMSEAIDYTRTDLNEKTSPEALRHIEKLIKLHKSYLNEEAVPPQADKSLSFKPPALLGFMSLMPPIATEVLETLHVYGAQHFLIPDLSLIFLTILALVLSTLIKQIQSLKYLLHTSIALLFSASTLQLLATLGYITFNHVVLPFDMIAVGLAIFGLSCTLLWETYSRKTDNPTLFERNDRNSTNNGDMAPTMALPPSRVSRREEAFHSRSATQLTQNSMI